MDVPSNWTCPICGQGRQDVAYVIPCYHQLCYGCAIWWAEKKPSCAVCGHNITTIRYSVRSDDDYLECAVPQLAEHPDDGLQDEQGPAEPVLIPPEHVFPAEVWAAFFDGRPENLETLLQWLQEEIQQLTSNGWWAVYAGQWTVVSFLCIYGLDEEALVRELQPFSDVDLVPFVRRLISTTAALYGPTIRRQLDHQEGHAAGGQEDSPAASPSTSHQETPASDPGRSTSPAGLSPEEQPVSSTGGSGHPSTATVPSVEEPQEPGQAAAAGPSAQGRDRLRGGPRRPAKRKAHSSLPDSPPPRKRRPWRRR